MLTAQLKDANAKISDLQSKPSRQPSGGPSCSGTSGGMYGCYPPWRYTCQGNETTKLINGKMYYWCTGHPKPMWVIHKPSECTVKKNKSTPAQNGDSLDSSTSLQVSQALAAITKGIEDDSSDDKSE